MNCEEPEDDWIDYDDNQGGLGCSSCDKGWVNACCDDICRSCNEGQDCHAALACKVCNPEGDYVL